MADPVVLLFGGNFCFCVEGHGSKIDIVVTNLGPDPVAVTLINGGNVLLDDLVRPGTPRAVTAWIDQDDVKQPPANMLSLSTAGQISTTLHLYPFDPE